MVRLLQIDAMKTKLADMKESLQESREKNQIVRVDQQQQRRESL